MMESSKKAITSTPIPLWKNLNIDDGIAISDAEKYGGLFDTSIVEDIGYGFKSDSKAIQSCLSGWEIRWRRSRRAEGAVKFSRRVGIIRR